MLIAVVACSLLLLLPLLRYFIDPACPECSSRSWRGDAGALSCGRCGWMAGDRKGDQLEMPIEAANAAGAPPASETLITA